VDRPGSDDPSSQNQDPKGIHKPSHSLSYLFGPPLLLLAYALAVGPISKFDQVFHLQRNHTRVHQAFELAYEPVGFLLARSPPVEHFYDWYIVKVWRVYYVAE
jgi:hypothetical protein